MPHSRFLLECGCALGLLWLQERPLERNFMDGGQKRIPFRGAKPMDSGIGPGRLCMEKGLHFWPRPSCSVSMCRLPNAAPLPTRTKPRPHIP